MEIDLARINPVGAIMDADPATVVGVLKEMKAAGKGGGRNENPGPGRTAQPSGRRHQVSPCPRLLDAFTIGAESKQEQEDLIRRIAARRSPQTEPSYQSWKSGASAPR